MIADAPKMQAAERERRREEFERVALVHLDFLYNSALRMTRNAEEAEDVVQETFVRAFRFFYRFRQGSNCKAWMFRIMKNVFINRLRDKAKEPFSVNFDEIEEFPDSHAEAPGNSSAGGQLSPDLDTLVEDDVKEALDSVPPWYRMVVVVSDISGFNYREIAEIMETPLGTVRSRLHRARSVLQPRLHDLAVSKGLFNGNHSGAGKSDRIPGIAEARTEGFGAGNRFDPGRRFYRGVVGRPPCLRRDEESPATDGRNG